MVNNGVLLDSGAGWRVQKKVHQKLIIKTRLSRAGGNLNAMGFFHFLTQSCLGWPPNGFFFSLMKRNKNQGLELLSDKFVKAFKAAAQAPMKNRE